MRSFLVLASLIASVLAIQITSPTNRTVWSVTGSNTVTWTSVNTDPSTFKLVLVNADRSVNQELAASVNTADGTISVRPPSGDFPEGTDMRINFLSTDPKNTGILAESNQFTISSSVSTTLTGTTTGTRPTTMSQANGALVTVTTSAAGAAATTSAGGDLNPTGAAGNSASGFAKASGALMAAASLLYVFVL
ncbi:hypothetical protein FRC03_000830 [Tulasnella sp. 419]|nr:hypothetical protein FRC02_008771 [Tulasnella sp. 418]KAG8965210.1 hypothetical protein FRC03_000830 [Tulasnella sp. 419]